MAIIQIGYTVQSLKVVHHFEYTERRFVMSDAIVAVQKAIYTLCLWEVLHVAMRIMCYLNTLFKSFQSQFLFVQVIVEIAVK